MFQVLVIHGRSGDLLALVMPVNKLSKLKCEHMGSKSCGTVPVLSCTQIKCWAANKMAAPMSSLMFIFDGSIKCLNCLNCVINYYYYLYIRLVGLKAQACNIFFEDFG